MSDMAGLLKDHAKLSVSLLSKKDSAEDLMIAVELADKHNLSHVQASVSQFFGNFNAERKKKFVTKYEYRLKQLKLKNLLNFIEMGLKLGNNELDFTFAFAVDEQPEAAGIYQKSVDSFKNVTLLIGDQQFDVHKEYLSFWSPYFDRLFFGDFAEKGKNKIELKEIDPEEFSILMKIIYSPRNIRIDDSNVAFLLKLSDRFEMKGIMSKCGYYITTSVKNSSFTIELIELLEIADTYNLIDVQWACLKRIKRMNPKESEKFRSENRLRLIKLSHLMLNNIVQAI